jgi:endoglucanase
MNRRAALKCLGASASALLGQEMLGRFGYAAVPAQSNAVFNQLGYLPSSSKIASVPLREGASSGFRIFDAHRTKLAYQGVVSTARLDEASGDRVAAADFSALTKPGKYRFSADTERSRLFTIDHQVYRDALRSTMRGFYGQRCGCAVDLGGGYRHTACHLVGAYHVSSGREGSVANSGMMRGTMGGMWSTVV